MSWAGLASNQTVSFSNLADAVANGVFTQKTGIPDSNEQITKANANTYVNINTSFGPYAAKASNQLVVKSNLQASATTTTTTTSAPGCQQIYLYPYNSLPCDHFGSLTLYDTDDALNPTRLWLAYECNITPVVGGFQYFSQGPGGFSYMVDNGGFVVSTTGCP
jgi:hypothetical protein